MRAHLHNPGGLAQAFAGEGIVPGDPSDGVVFVAVDELEDVTRVEDEMMTSFHLIKEAAAADAPAAFVLATEDLLGQRGPLGAMLANGLLSAVRSMGMEGMRTGRITNAVAYSNEIDPVEVAGWVARCLATTSMSGELISLGTGHLGKVIP